MERTIKVYPSRHLVIEGLNEVGTLGEHNAEILHFVSPAGINGEPIDNFVMRVIFKTEAGTFTKNVIDDTVRIDEDLTTGKDIVLIVQYAKSESVKWSSYPLALTLTTGSIYDGSDYRPSISDLLTLLRQAVQDSTGIDCSEKSFEELVEIIASMYSYENCVDRAVQILLRYYSDWYQVDPDDTPPPVVVDFETVEQCRQILGEAIENVIGNGADTPDFDTMSYDELVAYLETLRRDIGSATKSIFGDPDDVYWEDYAKISDCLAYLNSYIHNQTESMKNSVVQIYQTTRQLSDEELRQDDIIDRAFPNATIGMSDIIAAVGVICGELFLVGGSDQKKDLVRVLQWCFNPRINSAATWQDIISDIRATCAELAVAAQPIYKTDHADPLDMELISDVASIIPIIRNIVPSLKEAIERSSGEQITNNLSYNELLNKIEGRGQLIEAMYSLIKEGDDGNE